MKQTSLIIVLMSLMIVLRAQCDSVKDVTINVDGISVLSDYNSIRDNLLKERSQFNLLEIIQNPSNEWFMGHFQPFYKSMVCYEESLVNRFMDEPLVAEFRAYIDSLEITMTHDILVFKDPCCVEEFYDKLIEYSQQWDNLVEENPADYQEYIESEKFPRYPILYAFETIIGFHSLREHIENQLLELEAGDGIPDVDEDNPDYHFIVSDYMRTLLTPDCEIIVGDNIFLIGRYQDLIIFDLDFEKLTETKTLWRLYGETEGTVKAVQKGLTEPIYESIYEVEGPNPCPALCQDLYIKQPQLLSPSNACPYKYQFSVYNNFIGTCYCVINGTNSIKWDFGDGTSAYGYTVTHEYEEGGTFNVTVTIPLTDGVNNSNCIKTYTLNIQTCNVTINTPVKDNTYTGGGAKYIFTANASHCNGATPTQYVWNFGDGITTTTTVNSVHHVYTMNTTRTVTVHVNFNDDCSASNTYSATITGTDNCCREYTGDGKSLNFCFDKNGNSIAHDYSIYKLTHFFTTRQWYLWHRIVVKNTLYKRKYGKVGNKWVTEKAHKMFASFSGEYAIVECTLVPRYPNGHTKKNNSSQTYDYGVGDWFWVGKESLGSEFKLYITNTTNPTSSKTNVIKLHDKTCP